MLSFDEHNLTDEVVNRFAGCPDDRLKQVIQALVRHAHAFVKEVELTEQEWFTAIQFLTRTGQMCDDKRQEFILLSDVLGISMLVDAINHRMPDGATESTVLGPFYLGEHRVTPFGGDIAGDEPGERLFVEGTVSSPGGAPIAGATVDIWHSDDEGFYDAQKGLEEPSLRARFITDEKAGSASAPSCRRAIRSRMTGRSANCWRRRSAIRCVPPISISRSPRRATRRL